jgi:drug/metabolite transporter (DMT)-like permease
MPDHRTGPEAAMAGMLFGLAGVGALCAMDATAKSLGASLTVFQIGFVRYLGAALWLVPFLALTRRPWPRPQNLRRHASRGALMALTACLFFYGITNLPLAVATALAMTAPLYVSLFGILMLKEKFTASLALALMLGVTGSLIIIFGEPVEVGGSGDWTAWTAAMLAPISYAAAIVLLKHHSADEGAAAMTMAQSFIAAMIFLPLALPSFALPEAHLWAGIALIGFLGALGFMLIINGLRRLPASVFSVVDYTGILWAAALGLLFFGEHPRLPLWIGGGLIIAACAIGARSGRRAATAAT